MKFAAFQPYFFPYLGHFDLINQVDKWIVSNRLQYIEKGWMNRNRILHPVSGWTYINVPITSHHYDIRIQDVKIIPSSEWKTRIFGQLAHYRRQAPFYSSVLQLVEHCLENDTDSLAEFNTSILLKVCEYLGIHFDYLLESDLEIRRQAHANLSDWICAIAVNLGADEFINPPGGVHLYDRQRFKALGVKLTIQSFTNMVYETGGYTFEPALSILDVMMWNSRTEIKQYLDTPKEIWFESTRPLQG